MTRPITYWGSVTSVRSDIKSGRFALRLTGTHLDNGLQGKPGSAALADVEFLIDRDSLSELMTQLQGVQKVLA